MPGADGNPETVEQCPQVEVMNIAHQKRNHRAAIGSFAENTHAGNLFQPAQGIPGEFVLISRHLFHADGGDVIERFGKTCRTDIVGRTCFELERQLVERGFLERDMLNHLSSSLIGRQAVEPLFFAVKHSDTRRRINLMTGEYQKIGIQLLHIHRHVRDRLCGIYQKRHSVCMRGGNHLFDGVHRSQHIRHMSDTDKLRPLGKKLFILVEQQLAPIVHRNHLEGNPPTGSEQLPGNDVAVMLHHRNNHFIALAHTLIAKARSEQVDALGGSARENHLVGTTRIDEPPHRLARSFVKLGGLLREVMHSTMYVRIDGVVFVYYRIHHHTRFLCRSAVIQIDQRLAVYFPAQYRKVFTYFLYIVHLDYALERNLKI